MRISAAKRGYGRKWDQARRAFLAKHPSCVNVGKTECTATATCVDHIMDHRGNKALFWERKNWQPMCHHCHSVKTATTMLRETKEPLFDVNGNPTDADHHWST